MKYRLCVYQRDRGEGILLWMSSNNLYMSEDDAFKDREVLLSQVVLAPDEKCVVMSVKQWNAIDMGYKHKMHHTKAHVHINKVVRTYKGITHSTKHRPYTQYEDGTTYYPAISDAEGTIYKAYWTSTQQRAKPSTTVIGADVFGNKPDMTTAIGEKLKELGL